MVAPRQAMSRAWVISGLAVISSSIFVWLTPIYDRMEFWLRGSALAAFQGLLVIALFLGGTVLVARVRTRPVSLPASTAWGMVLGYLAGLFAILFHPLLQPDGARLFLDSIHITTPEALVALLWFPVRLLSWIMGAMTGLFIGMLIRIIRRQTPLRSPM